MRAKQGRKKLLEEVQLDSENEEAAFGNIGFLASGDPSQLSLVNDKELISKEKPTSKLERKGKHLLEQDSICHSIVAMSSARSRNKLAAVRITL